MKARLTLGTWDALQAQAAPLRLAVFVEEQGVPLAMEWDASDAVSLHAVLRVDGQSVATARLLPPLVDGPHRGWAYLGRMAVDRRHRGQGYGARVLEGLLRAARLRGDAGSLIHAQCAAGGFYEKHAYRACGERFMEAGIAHVEMQRSFGEPRPA